MRPIDANEAALGIVDCLNENPNAYYTAYEVIKMFVRALDKAPTLDVAPVVHGEWKVVKVEAVETKFACSKCGETILCGNDYFLKPTKHIGAIYPHCRCGAKMDGEEK